MQIDRRRREIANQVSFSASRRRLFSAARGRERLIIESLNWLKAERWSHTQLWKALYSLTRLI
jgi:hypothetical protein